jgi:lysophospholipase L1-like esterase
MTVLIIGDSQAAGAPGATLEQVLREAGQQVRRIGYVGHGAYDWTQLHWNEYVNALQARPEKVVLVFGTNDAPNTALERAMQQFKASASKVYYAGPPRYDERPDLQVRAEGIRQIASNVFGRRHLDAWPHTGPAVPRASDGAHFTSAGGASWGRAIAAQLRAAESPLAVIAQSKWAGPAMVGGAAVVVFGMWWWSRT